MFLILCAPPLLVFLYYMKSADVMLLCCYASDLVIKYRNFMAQEVTAHSGCEKYPNYHFLRVLSTKATRLRGYAVTFAFPNSAFLLLNSI